MIISIGDIVSVKETIYISKVKDIEGGKYKLYGIRGFYDFDELEKLVCVKAPTAILNSVPVNKTYTEADMWRCWQQAYTIFDLYGLENTTGDKSIFKRFISTLVKDI